MFDGLAMERVVPIETDVGTLAGRDCIYLDKTQRSVSGDSLVLEGGIMGALCRPRRDDVEIPYCLVFHGVAKVEQLDIDSWWPEAPNDTTSSFFEIVESSWARDIGASPGARHFVIQTYDEVFKVVCGGYTLTLGGGDGSN